MVPATLPPPTPFKLFVFAAGVFEMRLTYFLLAIAGGRIIRFGIVSLLTVVFGPQIVAQTKNLIRNHPSLAVLLGVAILLLAYIVFRLVRAPMKEMAKEIHAPHRDHP
jgi:membrane protein DedA with SNARE-associated domain